MRLPLLLLLLLPILGQAQDIRIETFNLGIANVHYLSVGSTGILIDSGEPGTVGKLLKKMARKNIGPEQVDYLLLTHGHADHAGGARALSEYLGARIIAGRGDHEMLDRGLNPPLQATSRLGEWVDVHIVKVDSYPVFEVTDWVTEKWTLPGLPGYILNMPGHTDGSLVYVVGENAFVGDLVRGALLRGHRARRHFFHTDATTAESHLQTLLDAGVRTFYVGHKGPLRARAIESFIRKSTPEL